MKRFLLAVALALSAFSASAATIGFSFIGSTVNSSPSFSGTDADMTGVMVWTANTYPTDVQAKPSAATFTASIAGTVMTVTAVAAGNIQPNQLVFGPNIIPGTYIVSNGTGTGANGTYNVNLTQTAASSNQCNSHNQGDAVAVLGQKTIQSWVQAQQKLNWDTQKAGVAQPPPLGWQ